MRMHKFFTIKIILLILILILEKGESFKCIVCRSNLDPNCDYNVDLRYSKECEPSNSSGTYCRKISQILKFKGEKKPTFIRECAYEKESSCYKFEWSNLAKQQICECEGENCNSARSNFPSILTVVLVSSLLWLTNFLQKDHT